MLYLLLLPLALLAPAGRHRRRRRTASRTRPYTTRNRVRWTCPLCWRTLATIGTTHTCPAREPAETVPEGLFTRQRIVHPAYEQWENRAVRCGDGLDDLRADLAPLVRQLLDQGVER